jgi:hypothetical protein
MVRIDIRFAPALMALMVAVASPAAAEDSNWLGSFGDFVSNGLGPARTLEEINSDEARPPARVEPAAPKLVMPVAPAAEPVVEPEAAPVVAAPAPILPAPVVKAVEKAKPAAVPVALPLPEPKPKPVVPVRLPVPPPPPEPLTSRIAATATADQAIKLGGSAVLYTTQIKKPVRK